MMDKFNEVMDEWVHIMDGHVGGGTITMLECLTQFTAVALSKVGQW